MKNKQHEFIIRAFLSSPVPEAIRRGCPELLSIDSVLGGYCTKALKGIHNDQLGRVISSDDKKRFSELIYEETGSSRTELVVYYRLAVLTEEVLQLY